MAQAVYVLCALTCVACAALLLRGYRRSRVPLLFWSCVCFGLLAIENTILFVDLVVLPTVDLANYRDGVGLAGLALLLFGLVWESQ